MKENSKSKKDSNDQESIQSSTTPVFFSFYLIMVPTPARHEKANDIREMVNT